MLVCLSGWQNHSSSEMRVCEIRRRKGRFTKCEGIESPIPQHLQMYFPHLRGYEVDWSSDSFLAVLKKSADEGTSFIGALHMLFGLIGNQQEAPWLRNTDHLPDRFRPVIKEVDASHVKHNVKTVIGKWQVLGISEKKIGVHLPAAQIGLAIRQHLRGEVKPE